MPIQRFFVFIFAVVLAGCIFWGSVGNNLLMAATTPDAPTAFTMTEHSLPGGIIEFSSPTLADLTGDGVPEIIIGTSARNGADGNNPNRPMVLVAYKGDGTQLWSKTLDAPVNATPAVGDLDHDGQPDIVIATGGDAGDRKRPSSILAFDRNGNQLWRYEFVDHFPRDGFGDGAFSSPTLCDVDGDDNLEVVVGGWDQRIYLLDHNGKAIWFNLNRPPKFPQDGGYYNADSIWSTAACADLNHDGQLEIIIGADITGGYSLPDGSKAVDGGFLYVFDKDGNVLVRRHLSETVYSSPAIGDLNNDGQLEILVGTGVYWWDHHGRKEKSYVYAFDTSQVFGTLPYADPAKLPDLPGWPQETAYPGFSSPALGDLDGNGDLEVVIGSGDPFVQNDAIPGIGYVYAWHSNGEAVAGWPIAPKNGQGRDARIASSPVIADIDHDGALEVLFSYIWDIDVYNADGSFQEFLPTLWTVVATPAVGDTDGDQKLDIWIGSGNAATNTDSGHLWHFESDTAGIGALPWPTFHHDVAHTGLVAPAAKPVSGTSRVWALRDTTDSGAPTQVKGVLPLLNQGGQPFSWSVSSKPSGVTLAPTSGQVDGGASQSVVVTVDTSGLGKGTHSLGNIQLALTSDGATLPESPLTVAVEVYVGPVHHLYLPRLSR